ncbi:MAG: hypothetical protein QNJ54_35670 [Prochloraceae cyanobacterium]|nr:hypothetical protein [Prochloraceae cyanobacterium]
MKNFLLIGATLTISFNFASVSLSQNSHLKVQNTQEQNQDSQFWGQLSPDFNTCYTAVIDSDNLAHSPQSSDSDIATTKFNDFSSHKNTPNQPISQPTSQICNF